MVVVDRPIDGVDCIYADHYLGGRLMAEHIVELGHNRIGMVTGPLSLVSARLRRQGFLDALGGRIQLAWEFEVPFLKELSLQARTQLKHLDISLVVCGNDVIAVGVMQQLQAAGIAVPAIVSIVGFDDIPWASVVTPSLTTIAQPYGEIGERAVDILLQRLMRADGPAVNEALPVTLMQRDSAIKRVREVKR